VALPAARRLQNRSDRIAVAFDGLTECLQKKDGPAYREVAKKYRGKADAEAKLYTHITTGPKVKVDGEEENHQIVKSKADAEIYNLIRFILSLPNP